MRRLPLPYRIFMLYVGVSDTFVIGTVSRFVSTAVFIVTLYYDYVDRRLYSFVSVSGLHLRGKFVVYGV